MNSFLTIEDVNTNNLGVINEFYTLDTSLLGDTDYSNKVYDFNKVTKTTNQDDSTTFVFEIRNSLWTGGFYVTDPTGDYIDVSELYSYDSTNHKLTITTNETDIFLKLYLCSFYIPSNFKIEQLSWIQKNMEDIENDNLFKLNLISLNSNAINGCYCFMMYFSNGVWNSMWWGDGYLGNGGTITNYISGFYYLHDGNENNRIYIKTLIPKIKSDLNINVNSIYRGQLNKVKLNINQHVLFPDDVNGYVVFEGNVIPIYKYDDNYYFDLNLREYNYNHVELKVLLNENESNVGGEYSFSFNVDYEMVTTESELLSLISEGGIVNIVSDLTLTDSIIINHDTRIIGNDCSIDLNGHGFILSDGVKCKLENVLFDNGDTAIIQGKNTKLELENVTFNNCVSSMYNNQGACILCDIDINSLDMVDDYYTVLKNCSFLNNHNCIVHGGELTVTGCEYINTDMEYSDKNNVAFLYQVDGNATLRGNSFDIDYSSDDYCENQESIGFAQALVKIGETAQINNLSHKDYIDGRFNLLDDNLSHLFCKYYYPKIEACVYSSPVVGFENKCACYSASNVNWVYKKNIQVTRAGTGLENPNQR